MATARQCGSFSVRSGFSAFGGSGVCLLGVVCNWTSVLQEPQRPTRLSRGSRGARGDDVVECLEMECLGEFSTPER